MKKIIFFIFMLSVTPQIFGNFYGVMPYVGIKFGAGLGESSSQWMGKGEQDFMLSSSFRPSLIAGIELDAIFLWENFLASLGINGYASLLHNVKQEENGYTLNLRWQEYLLDMMVKIAFGEWFQFYLGVGGGALFTTAPVLHWQHQGLQEVWQGSSWVAPVVTWEVGIYFAIFNVALRGYVNPWAWSVVTNQMQNRYQFSLIFGVGLPFHPIYYA